MHFCSTRQHFYNQILVIPSLNCSVADWGESFKKNDWSKCGDENIFITGFYRGSSDSIDSLEKAKCCKVKQEIGSHGGSCVLASWVFSLERYLIAQLFIQLSCYVLS